MYLKCSGLQRCEESILCSAPEFMRVYFHVVWWGASKIWSRWAPQQHVLPGALWHDHWADCKHRTSRSGLVPGHLLYKPLHLDRLLTWTTSKAQAAPANVWECPMYVYICVYCSKKQVYRVIWIMLLSTFCKHVKPGTRKVIELTLSQ